MDIIARAELASRSGLVEDQFVNTFAITDVPDLSVGTKDGIADKIRDFYIVQGPNQLAKMSDFLSTEVEHTLGLVVKLYDATGKLAGGPTNPLGSPVWTGGPTTIPDSAYGSGGVPAEVALCITLEGLGRAAAQVEAPDGADPGGEVDRPKQRHTGRIFFGPLHSNEAVVAGVAGQYRPGEPILDTAREAINNLHEALFADHGAALAVWSRRNAAMYRLEAVSVDNSFDTVRSRGNQPTTRQRKLLA